MPLKQLADNYGNTALHMALQHYNEPTNNKDAIIDLIKRLIEDKSYVDAVNFNNDSALDMLLGNEIFNEDNKILFEFFIQHQTTQCDPEKLFAWVKTTGYAPKDKIRKNYNNLCVATAYRHLYKLLEERKKTKH